MLALLMALLAGAAVALEVAPLTIIGNNLFIHYDFGPSENNSVLLCAYTLDEGQAVSGVLWQILKEEVSAGTFEWKPNAPATATGLLKDKVNLERDDSDLELTTLTYELSANYSCTVTADDDRTASARDEILIVDPTSSQVYVNVDDSEAACTVRASVSYYPEFPEPTVAAGLFSEDLGEYSETVSNWTAVRHANGSVAFSFGDRVFKVGADTPPDARFQSEIGVTKSDGTYLGQSIVSFDFGFRRSCSFLSLGANQTVSYNADNRTCFGQPYSSGSQDLEASVQCVDGYVSSRNVTSITVTCEALSATGYRWIPGAEGLLPEDLVCEPESAGGSATRVAVCHAFLTATLLLCLRGR
ncbi:uncharacterized protein LOC134785488 [Penaeus indicus]|uniref:uncharacterized protein LOC134785488 n=1 Tax=Penaeus indicus TaxID=29960 RepID=UPI00300D432E